MIVLKKLAYLLRGVFHLNSIENILSDLNNRLNGLSENIDNRLNGLSENIDNRLNGLSENIDNRLNGLSEQLNFLNINNQLQTEKLNSFIRLIDKKYNIFPKKKIKLITKHPYATYSDDFKHPRGAKNDNTHYLRFVKKCEEIFKKKISYLDLGCAGGGLVLDFLIRGHFAIGLEGSDYPSKNLTGEWSIIDNYLYNCDITKEFRLVDIKTRKTYKFDLIGLWEVFEHIPEEALPQLFTNIKNHLAPNGYLTASIALFKDEDKEHDAVYHVTVKGKGWWLKTFESNGFEIVSGLFEVKDFPRGSGNRLRDWSVLENPDLGFHIVAKVKE